MCTNYTPATPQHLIAMKALGLSAAPQGAWPAEAYPGFQAPIVSLDDGARPVCEVAHFGLIPRWAKDAAHARTLSRGTLNARSETVAQKPSFRAPWRERRFALVPMLDHFEPCWEDAHLNGNRSTRWRIGRFDGEPFCVAGLHERWTDPASGEIVKSFTLLTLNADGHELLGRMHRPGDEKRMLARVPPERYTDWLAATPEQAMGFMQRTPPGEWVGAPAPRAPAPQRVPVSVPPQAGLF